MIKGISEKKRRSNTSKIIFEAKVRRKLLSPTYVRYEQHAIRLIWKRSPIMFNIFKINYPKSIDLSYNVYN